MGLPNAFKALDSTEVPDNGTISITQLPANLLEAFIPGYSIISKFLLDTVGIDITLIVSLCLLVFGLGSTSYFLWQHAEKQFTKWLTSSINITSDDDIYDHIMDWLAKQNIVIRSRSLMAKTGRLNPWDLEDSEAPSEDVDGNELLNFSNEDAKVPPKFEPFYGSHRFWHNGRLFKFSRENKQMMGSGWGGQ